MYLIPSLKPGTTQFGSVILCSSVIFSLKDSNNIEDVQLILLGSAQIAKGIFLSPNPPGSFSLNAFIAVYHSSVVFGTGKPTLSNQSLRMYAAKQPSITLFAGTANCTPSNLP